MNVGFIGLGRMGMPRSRNLLKAGFQVTVHHRSQGKVEEMALLDDRWPPPATRE